MSFPRYPRYKDSGVEWLGEVPEGWDVARFRHTFSESSEKIEQTVVGPMLSVSGYRGIEVKVYEEESQRRLEEDVVGYRVVRVGQLVVNTMWLNYAGLGVSAVEGHVSPAYRAYWIDESLNKRFIHHLMRSEFYVRGYTKFLTGVRPNSLQMSREDLMVFPIILPPRSEQDGIAFFLDQETAKIDALIEEQRRLIELLKEKRQAIISHAVTKGLTSDIAMRHSGVRWIGDVPAQWSVEPVANRYSVQLGKMLDLKAITGEHLRPYLRVFDVQWGIISIIDLPAMDFDETARAKFALRKGDLLVNEGGSYPGRAAIWNEEIECYYQKALHRVRSLSPAQDNPEYLYYVLFWAANYGIFAAAGNEATIEHLPAEKLRRYRFAFPPIKEQNNIVKRLRAADRELTKLVSNCETAIFLLQERRSALISAAVTGKIDVRNHAPQPTAAAAEEMYEPA